MRAILLEKLETFLARCTRSDDLGLRLRGEQLTAGIRFIRLIRENAYDVVVGNPPYQSASKMDDTEYLAKHYPKGKADLYAAFLERGLQLAKSGGISALLTMRNWMFIQKYTPIREYLLDTFDLRLLGDVDRGAFEEITDEVVATVMSVFQKLPSSGEISIVIQPTPLDDNSRDRYRTNRKRAAVLMQVGRFEFKSDRFAVIKEKPIVYWWDDEFLEIYNQYPAIGDVSPARATQGFYNNTRFFRKSYEVNPSSIQLENSQGIYTWVPLTNGSDGSIWFEPLREIARWGAYGCEPKLYMSNKTKSNVFKYANEQFFFIPRGIAYTGVGANFSARMSRYAGVFADKGRSLFSSSPEHILCLLNSGKARHIAISLNPSISFQAGDVNRLPLFPIESADEIFAQLDRTFTEHEAARETSVEFKQPGASCWNYAQQWAQQAVDREPGKPLPDWNPVYDQPPAVNWVSWAIGVALGRFSLTPQPPLPKGEGETIQDSLVPLLPGEKGLGDEGLSKLLPREKGLGDEGFSELAGRERQIPKALLQRARELRNQQTTAEALLWECLRDRRLQNAKFRRQHNIGQIIADFYCHDAKLIIELDGGIHKHQQLKDQDRDTWAASQGLTMLRFANEEVLERIEQVLTRIAQYLPSSPQPPSPQGEGGAGGGSELPSPSGRGAGGEGTLPNGILYLSAYAGDRPDSKDSLNHPAAQPIQAAWSEYGSAIAKNKPLRDWLRLNFFKDVHVGMYEQRPIYFPLSSKNRNFVAYISIHRWADNTLQTLLADYLIPELRELEGETADLLESQGKGDKKQQAQAEERRATVQALYNELQAFINLIQQCAEQGPPAANPKDTPRQADAPFRMDLDDGVMVNSAALWCLLEPQWNKPKTWWSELCNAKGKKDYDWSHLAARYFCDRVDAKCQKDPSLAVAHGVFWKYHPAKAYEWELRLQDEIAPNFTIDEEGSDELRSEFEAKYPQLVADLREKEEKRRERKRKKEDQDEYGPLFETEEDENRE